MADDRDSLLREVEEELRREQMQKIWERYNGLILGGVALIVLAVGGYKWLESRRIADAEARGAEFTAAVQLSNDKKTDEAVAAFQKIADTGSSGVASLAKLHIAGAHLKAGKTDEALVAFERLANDASADQLLKNYAQLQVASLKMSTSDFTDIQNRLSPLAADSSPFKTSANELLGIAAFKAGNLEIARKHLEPLLIDPAASQAIQERIKIVLAEIAAIEIAKVAPPPAVTPSPSTPAPPGTADTKPADADKK
ncbi:MAG: tetratricopeptide repeat protein [Hyphomicrobium sp.]|nr:tetratricopeptide repeat protein [Hyphomicrobium sp.]